jgi:O-Antigen ligase
MRGAGRLMFILLLIPAAIAVWWMQRHTSASTLVNVYIPALFLFPIYFELRLKGLPPINDAQAVMLVFLVYILLRHRHELYFSTTDIWVCFGVYGLMLSETFHTGINTGIFVLMSDICSALLPYLCGKLFIEQYGQRTAMVKRMCWLLVLVTIGSLYEFRMEVNPYHQYLAPYFENQGSSWIMQTRWGHGRISGPYAHAITAGMIFLAGILLNLWLMRFHKWEPYFRNFRFKWASKGPIIMFILVCGEFMTQSRGPWLGLGFGFAVALVGFANNTRRAFTWFVLLACLTFAVTYPFLNDYTGGTGGTAVAAQNIDQEDAVYRRQLIDNYIPVMQAGGMWGWGITKFPIVAKQASIDNNFLYLGVTRGYFGLSVFLLLCVDVIFGLIRTGISFQDHEDRLFAFCMIGALAGILFSITTVYLGNQAYDLPFLLFGTGALLCDRRRAPLPQRGYLHRSAAPPYRHHRGAQRREAPRQNTRLDPVCERRTPHSRHRPQLHRHHRRHRPQRRRGGHRAQRPRR